MFLSLLTQRVSNHKLKQFRTWLRSISTTNISTRINSIKTIRPHTPSRNLCNPEWCHRMVVTTQIRRPQLLPTIKSREEPVCNMNQGKSLRRICTARSTRPKTTSLNPRGDQMCTTWGPRISPSTKPRGVRVFHNRYPRGIRTWGWSWKPSGMSKSIISGSTTSWISTLTSSTVRKGISRSRSTNTGKWSYKGKWTSLERLLTMKAQWGLSTLCRQPRVVALLNRAPKHCRPLKALYRRQQTGMVSR
jgi:hypothetical protein